LGSLLNPGDLLGHFEIKQKIGASATGIVYLAKDSQAGNMVALKLLSPVIAARAADNFEKFRERVLQIQQVAHPGVCRLFDVLQDKGFVFLSMEYIEGPTLKRLIRLSGALPLDRVVKLMQNTCVAVGAAHESGFIHRDLKPSNIILRGQVKVSILDFGLSAILSRSDITAASKEIETVLYMSPEVSRDETATIKSDIYSLGATLYECATGRPPFKGDNLAETLKAIKAGQPVAPSQINPEITPSLENVITKAMAGDPQDRFENAAQFVQALSKVSLGEAVAALPWEDDVTRQGPWHRNIDKSVQAIMDDPDSSKILMSRMSDTTILFSEIVGISAFFDEFGGVAGNERIQTNNKLIFQAIERYNGKVLKNIGDAVVSCFDTPAEGVGAAIGIQRALKDFNSQATEQNEKISVRLGLHCGKSVFKNNQAAGQSISIAAQIAALASDNQILISEIAKKTLNPELHPTRPHSSANLHGCDEEFKLFQVELTQPTEEPTPTDIPRPKTES
jgi:serine/threonine protein kinase